MDNKITSTAIKGLIISLILIVFTLALHFAGLDKNKALGAIPFILFFAGIIWSCISFAKEMNGYVSYGNVFTHGFKVSAAVAVIMIVFTIIMMKFIAPEMIEQAMTEATNKLEENNTSDEQIEQAMSISRKFFVPLVAGGVMLYYLLVGVIAALIGAAVAKKKPQDPFQQPA